MLMKKLLTWFFAIFAVVMLSGVLSGCGTETIEEQPASTREPTKTKGGGGGGKQTTDFGVNE